MKLTHWEMLEHARMAESLKIQRDYATLRIVSVLLAMTVIVLVVCVVIESMKGVQS